MTATITKGIIKEIYECRQKEAKKNKLLQYVICAISVTGIVQLANSKRQCSARGGVAGAPDVPRLD
jgi:S-adenosylmethionine/arginine decarboxylase-like enzyme